MGGRPTAELKCPRGVKLREFKHEQRIQIAFSYRGVECRELLPPQNVTVTSLNLAAGLRAEIQRKIDTGAFVYADYFPDSPRAQQFDAGGRRILIGKLLQTQLEIYERQVANKTLSPSTYAGYEKAVNGDRMKFWADKPLSAATPSALREWISGMGTTAKATRNLLTPLRSVFEDALNDDLIERNPFDRIALAKLLKQHAKASDYEVDPFTAAERDALIQAARADERSMVQFWFATGLRPGELIALKWPKIDFIGKLARIDLNQVVGVEKGPKTEAGVRDVELDSHAFAAITAQKAVTFLAGAHVWHNPRTGQPWSTEAQIRKTLWDPLCKRAGVRYRNPYQARHTFASGHLTAGANPWWLAQQLGHVDVQMVFRIYGKFISQDYQKPKVANLRLVGNGDQE
jgi:integrase